MLNHIFDGWLGSVPRLADDGPAMTVVDPIPAAWIKVHPSTCDHFPPQAEAASE